jgi:hypothetical protein
MSAETCWLTPDADAGVAVARFLADLTGRERMDAVHLVLKQLRQRTEPDRVLACELAWEAHTGGYWSQLRDDEQHPYESEEAYFREVLGVASWRTAYKRLAIGRMLTAIPEAERALVRIAVAQVGLAKATVIAPAIERSGAWKAWVQLARQMPAVTLQLRVSEALQAVPRGREPSAPGERFRRSVLSAMPDIEAMELVERFFEVGQSVVGTDHPVGIFLAGCRECLAEWEVDAAAKRLANSSLSPDLTYRQGRDCESAHVGNVEPADGSAMPSDHRKDDPAGAYRSCGAKGCPRGQNPHDPSAVRR